VRWFVAFVLVVCPAVGQRYQDLTTPVPVKPGTPIVIGFLGGVEKWNDDNRGVRRLVLRLRDGAAAESFSHTREEIAHRFLLNALDSDSNGELDASEKAQARIVLFGQSLGGSETLATARWLKRKGIPVLLTVQIDSVGLRDGVIPPNVRAAANLFQHEGLTFRGEDAIRAADPSRTRILGSFQYHYKDRPLVDPMPATWVRQTLGGGHAKMELDPEVWAHVERLIVDALKE
jgi:hypothetical protein